MDALRAVAEDACIRQQQCRTGRGPSGVIGGKGWAVGAACREGATGCTWWRGRELLSPLGGGTCCTRLNLVALGGGIEKLARGLLLRFWLQPPLRVTRRSIWQLPSLLISLLMPLVAVPGVLGLRSVRRLLISPPQHCPWCSSVTVWPPGAIMCQQACSIPLAPGSTIWAGWRVFVLGKLSLPCCKRCGRGGPLRTGFRV